ncbi:MAG: hypothetical protein OER95_04830 [Acidimicrobiia bacterium]|nr:hypothetical protein [Acidimicrobiia bacterium]
MRRELIDGADNGVAERVSGDETEELGRAVGLFLFCGGLATAIGLP